MKLFLKTISILLLMFLFLCPGAFASPVTVENWSFTSPSVTTWEYGISGWEHDGGDTFGGVWIPTSGYTMPVPDGNSIGFLTTGSIWQETIHVIEANNTFTLSLDIGNRSDVDFPDYEVSLMAYGPTDTVLASSGALIPGEGLFSTLTLSYTALLGDLNLGKYLGIEIWTGGNQLDFDAVRLSNDQNPVPEPASMLLLGTGLLGLAGYGRKKKFFKK